MYQTSNGDVGYRPAFVQRTAVGLYGGVGKAGISLTLLATLWDAVERKKRGFYLPVDDAAGNICQPLSKGAAGRYPRAQGGAMEAGAYTRSPFSSTSALFVGQGVFRGCLVGIYGGGGGGD